MAVFIVDASVVMHYLIADTLSQNAAAFFRHASPADQLIVPEFLLLECTNVIWKQVRFHGLEPHHADDLLRDLSRLQLKRVSVKRILPTALRMRSPLVSADDAQSRVAEAEGIKLVPLVGLR
jgi:predicted nucleic acid-binding protein